MANKPEQEATEVTRQDSALSRLRFRVARPEGTRRACKQSAAGTPFEDSGRATQPEIQALTRHRCFASVSIEAHFSGGLVNHALALASVLKKLKSMSATFWRPLALGWVPSPEKSYAPR